MGCGVESGGPRTCPRGGLPWFYAGHRSPLEDLVLGGPAPPSCHCWAQAQLTVEGQMLHLPNTPGLIPAPTLWHQKGGCAAAPRDAAHLPCMWTGCGPT